MVTSSSFLGQLTNANFSKAKAESERRLLKNLERVFAASEHKPLVAYRCIKCLPVAASKKQKLPQSTGKERIVCLTAERREHHAGLKATLHVLKTLGDDHIQMGKSFRLKTLKRVEMFKANPVGSQFIELTFDVAGYLSHTESRIPLQLDDMQTAIALLQNIYEAMLKYEKQLPVFSGVDMNDLSTAPNDAAMAQSSLEELVADPRLEGLSSGVTQVLSDKEQEDLQQLLNMFTSGVSDITLFESNLQEELDGLERANVHAIMSSMELGNQIASQLQVAINSLDDLDQSLQVFDVKLRHMREDIAAIELRNNRLEIQNTNNKKLLEAITTVLEKLDVPDETVELLTQRTITQDRLAEVISAAFDLHSRLKMLQEGTGEDSSNSDWLNNMRAVAEQHGYLLDYSDQFLERAQAFANSQLDAIAKNQQQQVKIITGNSTLQAPNHADLRHRFQGLIPLLEVMKSLNPSSIITIKDKYSLSMNKLLHKELKLYVNSLERAVVGQTSNKDMSEFLETQMKVDRAGGMLATQAPSIDWTFQMGEAVGLLSPHRAYKMFLDSFLPFLLREAEYAGELLQLFDTSAEEAARMVGESEVGAPLLHGEVPRKLLPDGVRVIRSLLEGIHHNCVAMADVARQAKQPLSMASMLDCTLGWIDKLKDDSLGIFLVPALEKCKEKLLQMFETHIQQLLKSVDQYNTAHRLTGAKTVKPLHVLPFVDSFVDFTRSMEELLSEATLMNARRKANKLSRTQAAAKDREARERQFDDDDSDDDYNSEHMIATPEVLSAAGFPRAATVDDARQVVDAAYGMLLSAVFDNIEKLSATDSKHGTRLKMENYMMLDDGLEEFAHNAHILEVYRGKAAALKKDSMRAYVRSQLEYVNMWPLFKFTLAIDEMRRDPVNLVPKEEFPLMHPAGSVKSLVASAMKDYDKKLIKMHERIKKHLEGSSPQLVQMVWHRLCSDMVGLYTKLEEYIAEYYPRGAIRLNPSPEQLAEHFKAI